MAASKAFRTARIVRDVSAGDLVKTIRQQTKHLDGKMVADPVQDKLLELIAAKKKALKKPTKAKTSPVAPATEGNVINIVDAFRNSLKANAEGGKRA